MPLISLTYFIFLFFVVILYWEIIPNRFRVAFLTTSSFVFICTYSVRIACLLCLLGFISYRCGIILSYTPSEKYRGQLLKYVLFSLIMVLCLIKIFADSGHAAFFDGLHGRLFFWGTSYIIFRTIHYIIESYRRTFSQHSLWSFLCYMLFFPIFLSGPIERFHKFYEETVSVASRQDIDMREINYGLYRIIKGIIKKAFIADVMAKFIVSVLYSPMEYPKYIVIFCIYALAIRVYMDFSGYTDIAIGSARLLGYKIMENFNSPFFQPNIAMFWRNWHISLYIWIRDYFFLPIFGKNASIYSLYLGIFFSMIIFHIWHGFSVKFLLLGVYHGFILVMWTLWQAIKRRFRFKRGYISPRFIRVCTTFFTFNIVSLGMIFLILPIKTGFMVCKYVLGIS